MDGKPSQQFRMRFDDDSPDLNSFEKSENQEVKRLSRRLTLVSILIPILLFGVMAFVYMDTRKKVGQTQQTRNTEILNLSKDLESRFSNLSIKQAKLEESLARQLKFSRETITQMETKLSETERALRESDTFLAKQLAGKSDTKAVADRLSALNKAIQSDQSRFKKEVVVGIEKVEKDIEAAKSDLTLDLAVFTETVEKSARDIEKLEKEIKTARNDLRLDLAVATEAVEKMAGNIKRFEKALSRLSKNQMDKSSVDSILAGQRAYIQEHVGRITRSLSDYADDITSNKRNIDLSQGKILELQRIIRSLEETIVGMKKKWASGGRPAREIPKTILEQPIE